MTQRDEFANATSTRVFVEASTGTVRCDGVSSQYEIQQCSCEEGNLDLFELQHNHFSWQKSVMDLISGDIVGSWKYPTIWMCHALACKLHRTKPCNDVDDLCNVPGLQGCGEGNVDLSHLCREDGCDEDKVDLTEPPTYAPHQQHAERGDDDMDLFVYMI